MVRAAKSCIRHLLASAGYDLVPTSASLPAEVRNHYGAILRDAGIAEVFRFLDARTFLTAAIKRAYVLGLHESPSLEILDVGTGVGYFPLVCRYYGHRVIAVDRRGNYVFDDAARWLQIDRRHWEVARFRPMPRFERRFDLVTSFMVTFDQIAEQNHAAWGIAEWAFLLRDIAENHLNPSGRIALVLNQHTLHRRDVMQFFVAMGAQIDGDWVVLRSTAVLHNTPVAKSA